MTKHGFVKIVKHAYDKCILAIAIYFNQFVIFSLQTWKKESLCDKKGCSHPQTDSRREGSSFNR